MADAEPLILGEFRRTVDERFRLSIPPELVELAGIAGGDCILAKERAGCLSLWNSQQWQARLEQGVGLVENKLRAGKLEGRLLQVQLLGRLLSTRHKTLQLAGRGRLLLPEGFREFLEVEAGGEVLVVGAAVCIEIWHPQRWLKYLESRMPKFQRLFDKLSG